MVEIKKLFEKYWPLLVLLVIFGFLFANLLSSHMLHKKPDGLYSGGSTWGDLAFHLTLISNFSQSGLRLDTDPTFSGSRLNYSFLPDLVSSWLVNMGISIQWALIIPSLLFILIFVAIFYLLTFRITKSKIGAFLAPIIFFFNGAIFSLYYFWQDWKISGLALWKFLGSMTEGHAHLDGYNIVFSNIISNYILPQRAFIPGLAIGLLAIYFLWEYWEAEQRKYLIYAGAVLAFMPLVHIHSFVALIIVCGFLAAIQFSTGINKKRFLDWVYFSIPILIIALPQFLLVYPWGKESFLRIQLGWMSGEDNIFWFWIKNLTPHIFLFAIAYLLAKPKLKKFYLAFFFLFVITNIIIFQPHDNDNIKLMLWWFILSIVLIANIFEILIKKWRAAGILLVILILISLTLTGIIFVYRESYASWRMFSNEDIALADFVKTNTPADAVFLTPDTHNHPVPCLAGRQIVMGYRGWLWTHGIDYREREHDVLNIFRGSDNAIDLIHKYNIKYIALDKFRGVDFNMNYDYFDKNFILIYKSADYWIYTADRI